MHVNGFWNLSNLYYIDKPKKSYTFKILFFPPFVNRWVSFSATALGDGVKGKQCNIGEALQMVVSGGLNDLSPLIGNMYYFHQNSPTVKCRTYKQSKPITRMPLLLSLVRSESEGCQVPSSTCQLLFLTGYQPTAMFRHG